MIYSRVEIPTSFVERLEQRDGERGGGKVGGGTR